MTANGYNKAVSPAHGWAALVSQCKPRFALTLEDEGRMPEDGCKQIGI